MCSTKNLTFTFFFFGLMADGDVTDDAPFSKIDDEMTPFQ